MSKPHELDVESGVCFARKAVSVYAPHGGKASDPFLGLATYRRMKKHCEFLNALSKHPDGEVALFAFRLASSWREAVAAAKKHGKAKISGVPRNAAARSGNKLQDEGSPKKWCPGGGHRRVVTLIASSASSSTSSPSGECWQKKNCDDAGMLKKRLFFTCIFEKAW